MLHYIDKILTYFGKIYAALSMIGCSFLINLIILHVLVKMH